MLILSWFLRDLIYGTQIPNCHGPILKIKRDEYGIGLSRQNSCFTHFFSRQLHGSGTGAVYGSRVCLVTLIQELKPHSSDSGMQELGSYHVCHPIPEVALTLTLENNASLFEIFSYDMTEIYQFLIPHTLIIGWQW
jgi:hypothetical protein